MAVRPSAQLEPWKSSKFHCHPHDSLSELRVELSLPLQLECCVQPGPLYITFYPVTCSVLMTGRDRL